MLHPKTRKRERLESAKTITHMITGIAGATGLVATPPGGGQRAEVDSGDPKVSSHTMPNNSGIHVSAWEYAPNGWPALNRDACVIPTIISGGGTITSKDGDTQAQGLDVVEALPKGWTGRWGITGTFA
ncbi:hypothetical protein N9F34_05450 [Alphaproteobacteria bacterium]|nr:hypothetical protein [Alphaproteobacteria bacterium]